MTNDRFVSADNRPSAETRTFTPGSRVAVPKFGVKIKEEWDLQMFLIARVEPMEQEENFHKFRNRCLKL